MLPCKLVLEDAQRACRRYFGLLGDGHHYIYFLELRQLNPHSSLFLWWPAWLLANCTPWVALNTSFVLFGRFHRPGRLFSFTHLPLSPLLLGIYCQLPWLQRESLRMLRPGEGWAPFSYENAVATIPVETPLSVIIHYYLSIVLNDNLSW